MKKNLLLLCLFVSFLSGAQVSTNLDSLYQEKSFFFKNRNVDSLFYYARKLMASDNPCYKYAGQMREINAYYKSGAFDTAQSKAVNLMAELRDKNDFCYQRIKGDALTRLFWLHYNMEEFDKAFQYCLEKEQLIAQFSDKSMARTQDLSNRANIASIKIKLGFYDEAVTLYKEMCRELSSFADELKQEELYWSYIFKSSVLNRIGDAFLYNFSEIHSGHLDSARFYYKEAFKTANKFQPPHPDTDALYTMRKAKVLRAEGKFETALQLIEQYDDEAADSNIEQDINFLRAILYSELKQYDKAIDNARSFLNYPKLTPSTERNTIAIYNVLADSFRMKEMRDSAFFYSQKAVSKLSSLDQTKLITNQSYYLYDISKVSSLNNTLLEEKRAQMNNFIVFSILGILVVITLFVMYRKKQQKNIMAVVSANAKTKKEYNIDSDLTHKIMDAINGLEGSSKILDANFTLASWAQELNTNTSYISNVLNEKKGISFKQYLIQLRIEYLLQLLRSNHKYKNYTVKALAEEIGYTNASAFTRAFKNYTGKTPSEFLKTL